MTLVKKIKKVETESLTDNAANKKMWITSHKDEWDIEGEPFNAFWIGIPT